MGSFLLVLPILVISATAYSLSPRLDASVIAGLSNQLAADIHAKLSNGEDNVFFSPASLSTAVAMLYLGARGETAQEMRRVLGYQDAGLADTEVHEAFKNLLEAFGEDSAAKEYLLYIANAVLTQKDYPILDDYLKALQEKYKATARNVDFQKNGKEAVRVINDWVTQKTHGQITKLIDEVDPATILVLLNAVYFKGTWKTQFDPELTSDGVFYNKGLETEQVKVPMMHLVEEFPYRHQDGFTVAEFPYQGKNISMFVFLPDAVEGLSKIEDKLRKGMPDISNMRNIKLHVSFPKFKMEYEKNMNGVFQALGIRKVFDNYANLSGISKAGPIAVSHIVHKAVVEVNEEGSEASGVTGIIIETRMGGMDTHFNVNHPFLFTIVDKRSGLILFQGSVNKL